jgi:hypothetical protein
MSDEVDTGVLRSIESHLRENPMSIESDKSDIQSATTTAGEPVLGTMLPDLFAPLHGLSAQVLSNQLLDLSAALTEAAESLNT